MTPTPHDRLWNRSFVGMLIAQFQAAFSDQCIHAAAIFYAIRQEAMSDANAISLIPILFYAPWAIFVTLAGYLADKYSKRTAIVFWKMFEIGIVMVTLLGFYLGSLGLMIGPFLVLSTVFLMGMQSAFFVPAKYGIMPEMFQPHLLSRGNGVLESLSFLAIILGTVAGGVLMYVFQDNNEYWIGIILVGLSLVGVSFSILVEPFPAANPHRPFPVNLFKPIFVNMKTLIRSRPLLFAVLGIAFFTFMVAFMRGTMYMHGETRNPRWSELHTSIVVGMVALGIGLGSPLAGWFSGGKVELGLVPLGALGMILALIGAAIILNLELALILCVIGMGFFTGFYIVPMYTLLQHRAPKESKGDMIASSNFINVIGAIVASVLFWSLVGVAGVAGIIQAVHPREVARGTLIEMDTSGKERVFSFTVLKETGEFPLPVSGASAVGLTGTPLGQGPLLAASALATKERFEREYVTARTATGKIVEKIVLEREGLVQEGDRVIVVHYKLTHEGKLVEHYLVLPADMPIPTVFNKEGLTRYLFLGAGLMTLLILLVLWRQLPDLFARSVLWLRAHGRYHLKVVGMKNLPTEGPVILATNAETLDAALQVVAITDRTVNFVALDHHHASRPTFISNFLAHQTDTVVLHPDTATPEEWEKALAHARETLAEGNLFGITIRTDNANPQLTNFVQRLRTESPAPVLPVYCGPRTVKGTGGLDERHVRVVIGEPMSPDSSLDEIRTRIRVLGDWIHDTERTGKKPVTSMIPRAEDA